MVTSKKGVYTYIAFHEGIEIKLNNGITLTKDTLARINGDKTDAERYFGDKISKLMSEREYLDMLILYNADSTEDIYPNGLVDVNFTETEN